MAEVTEITMVGLRREAARRLGCTARDLDPETGHLVELRRGEARRLLFGGKSPLNDAVAARIAGDKFHTTTVLADLGFRVPATARCLRTGHFRAGEYASQEGLDPARAFAAERGFPVVVKPNAGSRGVDVTVVDDDAALEAAVHAAWRRDYLALVQEPIAGFDLRVDLLDGETLFAYTRRPVRLVGNGESTIRELLAAADPRFRGADFESHLDEDPLWRDRAAEESVDLDAVPAAGRRIDFDTPILNLNRLCQGDRLDPVPEPWLDHVRRIGDALHLRHLGVDLKIRSLDQDPDESTVIEVNASPSLVHMARTGHFEDAVAAETRVVSAIFG